MMAMVSGGFQSEGKMFEVQEVNVEMMKDRQEAIDSLNHKIKCAKKLGHENKQTRARAIALLKSWLAAQEIVKEEDMKKIWKGLFFCFCHAKNHRVQEDLIENFVSLLENLDLNLSQQYFTVFLMTLRQEWPGISDLQLDKFYHLLKQLLRHMFIVLNMSCWDPELVQSFMKNLIEQTFLTTEKCLSHGVNFYIADIYLNELEEFLPLHVDTFVLLMEPFYAVLVKASDDSFLRRIKISVFDRLLKYGRNLISSRQEGKHIDFKLQNLGTIAVTMGATSRLFKLATTSTSQANKRVLSELHQEFSQLDRLLISSEISLLFPEDNKAKLDKKSCLDKSSDSQAKNIFDGVDGSSMEILKAKEGPRFHKSQLQSNEPKGITEEAFVDNTVSVQEALKEGEILNVVVHQDSLQFDDSVVSNLEKHFEKVATEFEDCNSPLPSLVISLSPSSSRSQKRKRMMSAFKATDANGSLLDDKENEGIDAAVLWESTPRSKISGGEKGVKKVTFVLKNNLVWKPSTPLPPHSLRVPPSATPRGSALKRGVPPGPISLIKESPSPKKFTPKKRCTMAQNSSRMSQSNSPRTQSLWRAR
ncbi:uncharacterized protein LOC131049743 isoform X1 [Cryptomeria japonica]|uniref:uncharacterized protein LOC131049743 isoform X1 n=2 Tax=Cryptomeria japonica TaxID=3369 RepID=UPI0025AB8E67|nr:uncharacterized protein LOC131049743 isoform X1 [Cryptomeria japonica]XP_057839798.1 uncharacterized protein LOC131049743 isoform X1 [Cryptomeria japonica]